MLAPEVVQELQRQLYRAGFPPQMSSRLSGLDPAKERRAWDGQFGPGTARALNDFIRAGGKLRPVSARRR
jgi:hypothetical protein